MNAGAIRCFILLMILGAAGSPGSARAQDVSEDALKERFRARYAQLVELRKAGKLGETASGFVEAVRPEFLKDARIRKIRDQENADRKALYRMLGRREGAEPGMVAERNALRNFSRAASGEYLRGKDGIWKKKP